MPQDIMKSTGLPGDMRNMTLQELVDGCDELTIKGNEVQMKKSTSEGTVSLKYSNFGDGFCKQQFSIHNVDKKKEYKETVHAMKKKGMTQKEIAYALDISQPYVSKLLKED